MKVLRLVRAVGVVALVLFCVFGLSWRAGLSDKGLAAYQANIKKAAISVSVAEEGRIIKVEPIQTPGQPIRPCKATLIFDVESQK